MIMRKAVIDKDHLFIWDSPSPIGETPTIQLFYPDGTSSSILNLSQNRSNLTAIAISNDRRSITLAEPVSSLKSQNREAYLITDSDDSFPITVNRIAGSTLILADILPREISFSANSQIQFATWTYTIPANLLNQKGVYTFRINYLQNYGSVLIARSESGTLKVCKRPFDTGLDHNQLTNIFPNLADVVARRQNSFSAQIESSLDEVISIVRDLVVDKRVTEDEILNPERLLNGHSYFAAARIYEINNQFDIAESFRLRGEELIKKAMRIIDLDINENEVDELEEQDNRLSGGGNDLRGNMFNRTMSYEDESFSPDRGTLH